MFDRGIPRPEIEVGVRTSLASVEDLLRRATVRSRDNDSVVASATELIAEDLLALSGRDPAAHGDPWYCYHSSSSFAAVAAHRVAHALLGLRSGVEEPGRRDRLIACAARRISEDAKVRTGVEIHPAACIGRRIVVDHGWGTVIGEHTRIGDDCYFLQNVVLGSRNIGRQCAQGKRRHPTVGDRVVIAGDVYVFGAVTIGDDCFLEAGARITEDVPGGTRVRVVAKLQLTEHTSTPRSVAVLSP
ncbi:MAG: serine acetyltransferase [Catenulispora sp.]|nr:serine acetyltransferase [Catenulispora sp.]